MVALIFSLIIGIGLVSFIQLANNSTKISYRTHYLGVAMNIAETGLEQAMWEINNSAGTWTGWESGGASGSHRRTFDLGKVEGGATAVVKVYAQESTGGTSAWIATRAIVTPPKGTPIEKWVKVTLSKRSLGAVGGIGKDGIVSSGNQVVMGSWNSDPDKDPTTPPIPYSASVANDAMTLATIALDATLNSGNADVNGSASVGSDTTDAIQVGSQGYIGPFGTPAGTKDPNSVSANFSADLPEPTVPSGTYTSLGSISTATTLPRPGDIPNADGVYYYSATDINLNGSALVISAGKEVVLNVTQSTGTAVSLGGNGGAIKVAGTLSTNTATGAQTYTTGKLALYTAGDFSVTGQAAVTNTITTQNYTPATTVTTTTATSTTISNVTAVYGKGQQKDTVIGWSYTQASTIATTVGTTTTTTTSSNTYQTLIASGGTQPTAGTTTTSNTTVGNTAESTTDTGSYVGQPDNLRIYGTRTAADVVDYGSQQIKIAGNGSLSSVVYAPNAAIEAKGGGNSGFIYGSLVGKTLKFTGNDCFYYDESLGNSDDGARLGISSWDEMVSYADRSTYSTYLTF